MKQFFSSPEFESYSTRVQLLDELYDVLAEAMKKLKLEDKSMQMWDLETALQDQLHFDANTVQTLLNLTVIPGQEYTSLHEVERLRIESQAEAFQSTLAAYRTRTQSPTS